MMCLISSRADLALKSQCVMSSAPANEIDTQFSVSVQCLLRGDSHCVLLWRRFHRDPSRNVPVVPDCSFLTPRGPLFVVILLLLSDQDRTPLACPAPLSSALHPHQCDPCCWLESRPGWILSSLLSSRNSCQCSGQCLW